MRRAAAFGRQCTFVCLLLLLAGKESRPQKTNEVDYERIIVELQSWEELKVQLANITRPTIFILSAAGGSLQVTSRISIATSDVVLAAASDYSPANRSWTETRTLVLTCPEDLESRDKDWGFLVKAGAFHLQGIHWQCQTKNKNADAFITTNVSSGLQLAPLVLSGCSFTNTTTSNRNGGSAVSAEGIFLQMSRCNFSLGSTWGYDGGDIYVKNGKVLLEDCWFELSGLSYTNGVYAVPRGGSVAAINTSLEVRGCYWGNIWAESAGGALYAAQADGMDAGDSLVVDIRNSTFEFCESHDEGGAVVIRGATNVTFSDVNFKSNSAGWTGGAVFLENVKNSMLFNINASLNVANSSGGGALSVKNMRSDMALTMQHVRFVNNSCLATGSTVGGALELHGNSRFFRSIVDIRSTEISGSSVGTSGGGLFARGISEVKLTASNFSLNKAPRAGGLDVGNTTVIIDGCRITINTAEEHGGGILAVDATLKMTNTFCAGNQASRGGALAMYQVTALVNGCHLYRNNADGDGGGIHTLHTIINLTNSVIGYNSAILKGGGLAVYDSQLTLQTCNLTDNSALRGGGAVYAYSDGGLLMMANSIVTGNLAARGGAIMQEGGSLNVTDNSLLQDNTAYLGGALHASFPAWISLADTAWSNNTAAVGGALSVLGGNITLKRSSFTANHAKGKGHMTEEIIAALVAVGWNIGAPQDIIGQAAGVSPGLGGALYFDECDSMALEYVTLANNTAVVEGGGLFLSGDCNITAVNVDCIGNQAAVSGGAVAVSASNVLMSGMAFMENRANISGGAVVVHASKSVLLTNCTFNGDTAAEDGGALSVVPTRSLQGAGDVTVELEGCSATQTVAEKGFGGAISVQHSVELVARRIAVAGSRAAFGGGVSCAGCALLTIEDSNFIGCSANAGGALYAVLAAPLRLANTTFSDNTCKLGSAGSKAPTCSTEGSGGGACLHMGEGHSAVVAACSFSNNTGMNGGGLLFASNSNGSQLVLTNSTFLHNLAVGQSGGALYAAQQDMVNIVCAGSSSSSDGGTVCTDWQGNYAVTESQYQELQATGAVQSPAVLVVRAVEGIPLTGASPVMQSQEPFNITMELLNFAGYDTLGLPASTVIAKARGQSRKGVTEKAVVYSLSDVSVKLGQLFDMPMLIKSVPGSVVEVQVYTSYSGIIPSNVTITLQSCPAGYVNNNGVCTACPEDFFSFKENAAECRMCPNPTLKAARCMRNHVIPRDGWWHSHPRSPQIIRCYNQYACVHNQTLLEEMQNKTALQAAVDNVVLAHYLSAQCSEGYSGNLCMSCADGYGSRMSRCLKCPEKAEVITWFTLARVWDAFLLVLLYWFTIKSVEQSRAHFLPSAKISNWGQANAEPRPQDYAPDGGPENRALAAQGAEDRGDGHLSVIKTMLLDYMQVLGIVRSTGLLMEWPRWMSSVMSAAILSPITTRGWVSAECVLNGAPTWVQIYGPELLDLIIPAGYAVLLLTVGGIVKLSKRDKKGVKELQRELPALSTGMASDAEGHEEDSQELRATQVDDEPQLQGQGHRREVSVNIANIPGVKEFAAKFRPGRRAEAALMDLELLRARYTEKPDEQQQEGGQEEQKQDGDEATGACAPRLVSDTKRTQGRGSAAFRGANTMTQQQLQHVPYIWLGLLTILEFFYPIVALSSLSFFACKTLDFPHRIDLGDGSTAVGSYWMSYLDQQCSSALHQQLMYFLALPVAIVIGLGYPLGLVIWLVVARCNGRFKNDAVFQVMYGHMYTDYRDRFFFWLAVVKARNLVLVLVVVLLSTYSTLVQLYALWGVMALIAGSHVLANPYDLPRFNQLESLTLSCLSAGIFLCLGLMWVQQMDVAEAVYTALMVLYVLLNATVVFTLLYFAGKEAHLMLLNRADANNDGVISWAELRSFLKLWGSGHVQRSKTVGRAVGKSWSYIIGRISDSLVGLGSREGKDMASGSSRAMEESGFARQPASHSNGNGRPG